jgi:hypothetical protein
MKTSPLYSTHRPDPRTRQLSQTGFRLKGSQRSTFSQHEKMQAGKEFSWVFATLISEPERDAHVVEP